MARRPRPSGRALLCERLEDRVTPSGLDPSFGVGGRVRLPVDQPGSNAFDEVHDVVALPDGRILFAGLAQSHLSSYGAAVGRLNSDGTPDPTFSGDGVAVLDGIWFPTVRLAASPDGGAVVVGEGWRDEGPGRFIRVARLTASGDLDPTFDEDGVVEFEILFDDSDRLDGVSAVAAAADGRVLLAGPVHRLVGTRFDGDFGVLRLTADGQPDPTFGTGGLRAVGFDLTPGPDSDRPTELAALPDGRVLVAGTATVGAGETFPSFFTAFAIARLTAGGDLDPTFGDGGKLSFNFPGTSTVEPTDLTVLPDGGAVLAGRANRHPPETVPPMPWWAFAAARVTAAGRLDPTFGDGGRVTVGGPDRFQSGGATGVGVLADGKVVLAGWAARPGVGFSTAGHVAVVVRLNPDGAPDEAFGSGGLFAVPFAAPEGNYDLVTTAAVLPDGRALLGGIVDAPDRAGTRDLGFTMVTADPGPSAVDLSYPPEWDVPSPPMFPVPPIPIEPPIPPPPVIGGPFFPPVPTPPSLPVRGPLVPIPPGDGLVTADVDGDGIADVVTTTGPTGSLLSVMNGADGSELVAAFAPFEAGFAGRLSLAAADLDGDGRAEVIVAAGEGGAPRVAVFRGADLTAGGTTAALSFFGIDDPAFRGGAAVVAADVTGDGTPDLVVTAGPGGGPRVVLWDGRSLLAAVPGAVADFFAFEHSLRVGVVAAAGDIDHDGRAELAFGVGAGGAPRVRAFDGAGLLAAGPFADLDGAGAAQIANFFAGDPDLRGGVRVALRDADGDGGADLVAGSGEGESARVRVYLGPNLLANPTPTADRDLDPFGGAALTDGVFVD